MSALLKVSVAAFAATLLTLYSCKDDVVNPVIPGPVIPAHFPSPHYTALNNPYSAEAIELGRQLFYDPILSVNNTKSCADCHAQNHGFADHNTPVSSGIYGRLGSRNSPVVFNMIWNTSFMWDGGINHIEVMPLAPIQDTLEMGSNLDSLLQKLSNSNKYVRLFNNAFGENKINDQKLLHALAQFMGVMISSTSRYDDYVKGKVVFTSEEKRGLELFRSNCSTCHKEPLFTDYSFANTGLDQNPKDIGRMRITQKESDRGKFKVPTLRNIEVTYPYMHDGRFDNLKQVLDHYTHGVVDHPNTDSRVKAITLSEQDKADIIAFLKTLSDYKFMSDPRFARP